VVDSVKARKANAALERVRTRAMVKFCSLNKDIGYRSRGQRWRVHMRVCICGSSFSRSPSLVPRHLPVDIAELTRVHATSV